MAETSNNIEHLMLEQFRRVREDIKNLKDAVTYIHTQQLAQQLELRAMRVSLDGTNDLLTALTARFSRIEARLELSGDPAVTGFAEPQSSFEPHQTKRG